MRNLLLISDVQTSIKKHIWNYKPMINNINIISKYFDYSDNQCYVGLLRPDKLGYLSNDIILPRNHIIYKKDKYSMFDEKLFCKTNEIKNNFNNNDILDFSENVPKDTNIVVTGVQTEWCVWNTIKELSENGYKNITCISDATSSQDLFTHKEGLKQIDKLGANIMPTDIFIKQNCDDIYRNFYIDYILKNRNK